MASTRIHPDRLRAIALASLEAPDQARTREIIEQSDLSIEHDARSGAEGAEDVLQHGVWLGCHAALFGRAMEHDAVATALRRAIDTAFRLHPNQRLRALNLRWNGLVLESAPDYRSPCFAAGDRLDPALLQKALASYHDGAGHTNASWVLEELHLRRESDARGRPLLRGEIHHTSHWGPTSKERAVDLVRRPLERLVAGEAEVRLTFFG